MLHLEHRHRRCFHRIFRESQSFGNEKHNRVPHSRAKWRCGSPSYSHDRISTAMRTFLQPNVLMLALVIIALLVALTF
jgi:hypothetical protein